MLIHLTFRAMIVVLGFGVAVGVARPASAGPYLFRSIELSVARSQKECEGHVIKVLGTEKQLTVDKKNLRLAVTGASTVHVDCIFVGRNEQGRNQWIFYIAIASTSEKESRALLDLLRSRFKKIVIID